MSKRFLRIAAILISATMIFDLLPVSAFAAQNDEDVSEVEATETIDVTPATYTGVDNASSSSDGDANEDGVVISDEHAYDPFAEIDAKQAEEEYRESVEYEEKKVLFSVRDYRKRRGDATYLDDSSALCKDNKLKKVSCVFETKSEHADKKPGYTAYDVYYEAYINTSDVWDVVDKLNELDEILMAEPDYIWQTTGYEVAGADEINTQWCLSDLNVPDQWDWFRGKNTNPGEGVVVAVIDTGVDYTHKDLRSSMWKNEGEIEGNGKDDDGNGYVDDIYGMNFIDQNRGPMDDNGHGTHVAGIIGMSAGNGGGVGVAYGAKIMAIKAGQANGSFSSTNIAKAITYAAENGADIINMSFGGEGRSNLVEAALQDAFDTCVLIAAAGNDGLPTNDAKEYGYFKTQDMYPAGYTYVLGVMASDSQGQKASFSNWDFNANNNCEYEMIAPGVNIYSSIPGNRYALWSGTSMAAPVVAGAAALIRSRFTDKSVYTSRYIMGQLASATSDVVYYIGEKGDEHAYSLLNIHDSLTKSPKPNIYVSDSYFFDREDIAPENNGDGIIQAGETIDMGVAVRNQWGIAKDVTISIDANAHGEIANPYVTIIDSTVEIGEIGTYATGNNGFIYDDGVPNGVLKTLRLKVADNAPNNLQITINIHVTAKNGMNNKDQYVYSVPETNKTFVVQNGRIISGIIEHDMILTNDTLWIIDGTVLVGNDVTLSVEPGTQIQFGTEESASMYEDDRNIGIRVSDSGVINFNGTYDNPIVLYAKNEYYYVSIEKYKYIYQEEPISVNMDYVIVYNPRIMADKVNHAVFYYERGDSRYERLPLVRANELKNSYFKGSTYTDLNCDGIDTVLDDNSLTSVIDSSGNRNREIKNSVFYHNTLQSEFNYGATIDVGANNNYKNNAMLNNTNVAKLAMWYRIYCNRKIDGQFNVQGNYWGTDNSRMIEKNFIEPVSYDFRNPLTLESDSIVEIYPFVTDAYVADIEGNRIENVVGGQDVKVHVKFNRDMAEDVSPTVTYGGELPYADYVVGGTWINKREWVGTVNINPWINQGTMYFRIKGAAADSDRWLKIADDAGRFKFTISKTGAQSMTLQGSGSTGKNQLSWIQDDYETLAGYNLYRSLSYDSNEPASEQNFTRINSSIIVPETDDVLSVTEYEDADVEQGVDYYYYFTVVDTAFNESEPSNVVMCTPVDEDAPVIEHTAMGEQVLSKPVTVKADVTDNVEVKSVTLYYRQKDAETYKSAIMRNTTGDTYQAVIGSYEMAAGEMEYYIVADDGTNQTYCGTAELPNRFAVVNATAVESVSLDNDELTMEIGSSDSLTASIAPATATEQGIVWISSDSNIVAVDDSGNLQALEVGEVTITARTVDGNKEAACVVTVIPKYATAVTLNMDSTTLHEGESVGLTAIITPADATYQEVTWSTEDTDIVSVSNTGRVQALKVGEATVKATSKDGKAYAECAITVEPVVVQSVGLDETSIALDVDETKQLTATVYPANATEKGIVWTSTNEDVAQVDENGLVTAIAAGNAVIRATSKEGDKRAICSVKVNPVAVESVTLDETEATIKVAGTLKLMATVLPDNASDKSVTWSSDDEDVATVAEDGTITGVSIGETTITATAVGGESATCTIKVIALEVESITLDEDELELVDGESAKLTATVLPNKASVKSVTWSSGDEDIATVDAKGNVTAVSPGKTSITAQTSNDKKATCQVTVTPKYATSVTLNMDSATLHEGEGVNLTATIAPKDVTYNEVVWSTEDDEVISLSVTGRVTALKVGEATVKATSKDGKAYAECIITVEPVAVQSVGLDETSIILDVDETKQLTATVYPANATIKDIVWTSTNEDAAKVDENGMVTAIATGNAVIRATSKDGDKRAICSVKVNPVAVESVTIDETEATIKVAGTVKLMATVLPDKASDKSVTWSSGDEKVATVAEDGMVTGVSIGETTITAAAVGGESATCTVKVVALEVESITLDEDELELVDGESAKLTATVLPVKASDKSVIWSSGNEDIVTVDAKGNVTAVAPGKTTITAKTSNDKNATCQVTVTPKYAMAVTLNMDNVTLHEGEGVNLTATITPKDVTYNEVVWSTEDDDVISLSSTGRVTALKVGEATVKATSKDGKAYAECAITVDPVAVQSVGLDETNITLDVDETKQLTATVYPDNATEKGIVWTSTNEDVAQVDENGLVMAIAAGNAVIRAKSKDGDKRAICSVKVNPVAVESVTLDETEATIKVAGTVKLTATVLPDKASDKSVTWSSGDDDVATVAEDGTVTGVSIGETTITATAVGGESATCTIKVVELEVESITLDEDELELVDGESAKLTATVLPVNASDKSVTWSSGDEAIATVDAKGNVTAVSPGKTSITTQTSNDKKATCQVTVTPKYATAVTLNKDSVTLHEGEGISLTATITPKDVTYNEVIWSTEDDEVISLSATGYVTALKVGEATVKATSKDGKAYAECIITVEPVAVQSVGLDETSIILDVDETKQLTATVYPANATIKDIVWTSTNEDAAQVDENGMVTAIAAGTAVIRATSKDGDKRAICAVTVKEVPVSAVTLNETEVSITPGNTVSLEATVHPDKATDKSVTWSSTDEDVAKVDENGLVTAIAPGDSTITATAVNGKSAACAVTVQTIVVESITLDKTEIDISKGGAEKLDATVLPENASDKSVTWSSADEDVAKVENGIVTGIAKGETKIYATASNGDKAECNVIVKGIAVKAITLDETQIELGAGDDAYLVAEVYPDNADDAIIEWTSADPEIATVDENGHVQAIAAGTTVVKASVGDVSGICSVKVNAKEAAVESVAFEAESVDLTEGEMIQLAYTITPAYATNKKVSFESLTPSVASVDDKGNVIALLEGSAIIKITTEDGGKEAECTINVAKAELPPGTKDIRDCTITMADSFEFTGETITPEVSVAYEGTDIEEGVDYSVLYLNNIHAGTAYAQIKGLGGYAGVATSEFTISAKKVISEVKAYDKTYDGTTTANVYVPTTAMKGIVIAVEGEFESADAGKDKPVILMNLEVSGDNADDYEVILPDDVTASILPMSIAEGMFEVGDAVYAGSVTRPTISSNLIEGSDYTAKVAGINAGMSFVRIKGKGNYTGEASCMFNIAPAKVKVAINPSTNEEGVLPSDADPLYELSYDGYIDEDTEPVGPVNAPKVIYDATQLAKDGETVSFTLERGSGYAGSNYSFDYSGNAQATVKLAVKPDDKDKDPDKDKDSDKDKDTDKDKDKDGGKDGSGKQAESAKEKAIRAAKENKGSVSDNTVITPVGSGNKMTYSITPSANGIITVAKGNKIVITGYEAKSAVIGTVEKKCISISKTGTLKAKKATIKPITFKYRANGKECSLTITILDPKDERNDKVVSGNNITVKKLGVKAFVGDNFDVALKGIPLNLGDKVESDSKGALTKTSGTDSYMYIGDDGFYHVSGKAVNKGTAKISFKVNGTKFTMKVNVKAPK